MVRAKNATWRAKKRARQTLAADAGLSAPAAVPVGAAPAAAATAADLAAAPVVSFPSHDNTTFLSPCILAQAISKSGCQPHLNSNKSWTNTN